MKFSKSTGCFYPDEIYYENPPSDLIAVTHDDFHAAMRRATGDTLDVDTGKLIIIAAPPSPAHVWQDGKWVLDTARQAALETQARADQWGRIKAERDRRKAGGVKVGAKWFHSDEGSRIQQMGLVMMGASIPANLQWKTMDGSFVQMTPALAQGIFAAATAYDVAVFAAAETHRAAMEADTDPAAYDCSTGWPKMFWEA